MSRNQALVYLLGPIVVTLIGALVQQMRFPETGAWIVAFIAVFFLLLTFAVVRLRERNEAVAKRRQDQLDRNPGPDSK